jgi:hypothetical protein
LEYLDRSGAQSGFLGRSDFRRSGLYIPNLDLIDIAGFQIRCADRRQYLHQSTDTGAAIASPMMAWVCCPSFTRR